MKTEVLKSRFKILTAIHTQLQTFRDRVKKSKEDTSLLDAALYQLEEEMMSRGMELEQETGEDIRDILEG
jgi:protein subunit release factor B